MSPLPGSTSGHSPAHHFDVAILGSGIAGTMLGIILARHGVSVLLIDATSHPRFAVGESTTAQFSLMVEFMSERFSIPEFKSLVSPERIREDISPACGIKRAVGFLYHHEGREQDPMEAHQLGLSEHLRAPEKHLFRQDIDAHLLYSALRCGVQVRQETQIAGILIDAQGVRLTAADGETFRVRYVVDASGFRSLLADKFQLREKPTRLKTCSRTIFTHMIDVQPFDDCAQSPADYEISVPWSETTINHLFDGGWIWVIPFNNLPRSVNPLCSVGLSLDLRRFPKGDLPPEQEFGSISARFPSIARQFEPAKAARKWVGTDRLQYSSRPSVGYRFCLMAHAANFVDAMYAKGLADTTYVMNALVPPLLDALREDDFSVERFAGVERLQQTLLDFNDRLVSSFYTSLSDFALSNAWLRAWAMGAVCLEGWLFETLDRYRQTGDPSLLTTFDDPDGRHQLFLRHGYKPFIDQAVQAVEDVETRGASPDAAARKILALLDQTITLPAFGKLADSFIWSLRNSSIRDLSVNIRTYRRWQQRTGRVHGKEPSHS